jgi:hypothetical protein
VNAAKPNQQKGRSRLSPGLRLLSALLLVPLSVGGRLPEYTEEYLVARYADRFPADVEQLAQEELEMHGVQLPH